MQEEILILVDKHDQPQGTMPKMQAHIEGRLHRAFSVMIYNKKGELLIQKRADVKYHSAGLWANTCCGHPRVGEDNMQAAQRRLNEEMGFSCDLKKVGEVCYELPLENGLHEHEYTHVFSGVWNGALSPNPEEVSETNWVTPSELRKRAADNPAEYARWFEFYLREYYDEVFS
ncbi:isopentenyl-diphosphate Delta-isomerase [Rickettsiaceae bacterium]|nr:isopentenyl-diphosphate Delta-isomerase [Rickettsiaceae bacterium]